MKKCKSPRVRGQGSANRRPNKRGAGPARAAPKEGPFWLYGAHTVLAALANSRRNCHRLLLTGEASRRHGETVRKLFAERRAHGDSGAPNPESATREEIAQHLSDDAVHQGLVLLAEPLEPPELAEILALPVAGRAVVVVLDQVTDPHNVGAVLRSAAAFGARAVVTTKRHAPPESGALAKAASGALEQVPYLRTANLAQALESLKKFGFWCLGLGEAAEKTLAEADPGGPLALVLGAEGPGLRRLTRESCDLAAHLPTREPIKNLNVSNAAAVALYELLGRE